MQNLYIPLLLILGASFLSIFNSAMSMWRKLKKSISISEKNLKKSPILRIFHKKQKKEDLYFIVNLTKKLSYLIYSVTFFLFLLSLNISTFLSIILVLSSIFIVELISNALGSLFFEKIIFLSSILASFYILLFLPITFPIFKLTKMISKKTKNYFFQEKKLIDLIYDIDTKQKVDQKILKSLITFKEKVAREVMIPRVQVFSLPSNITIKDASKKIVEEGFSRIPIYKDKMDNIIGILMYKDILNIYAENETCESINTLLATPVESFVKNVIYIPENKKISTLFQEFRSKQSHFAIVVNEYGGMEGVITIEDILEELVGEIQDEYDIDEEIQFLKLPNGHFTVDAKMSIVDLERELNIKLPHSPEYETIGGFIFHMAGAIPSKGWSLHLDEFDIEVLSSNERCIEKIKLIPTAN